MIDRQRFTTISADINAAVNEVLAKHKLPATQLDIRRGSDGSFFRICKTDVFEVPDQLAQGFADLAAAVPTPGIDAGLAAAMRRDGIASDRTPAGDRLIGYKASRPSYPYTYVGVRGGKWRCSREQARARFGVVQPQAKSA